MLAKRGKRAARGGTVIEYAALDQALMRVADEAITLGLSVHLPRIGSSMAGGRWQIIEQMIEDRISAEGLPVIVYDLSAQPAM